MQLKDVKRLNLLLKNCSKLVITLISTVAWNILRSLQNVLSGFVEFVQGAISSKRLIILYDRMNCQLSEEVSHLKEQLRIEQDRNDELQIKLDTSLGLVKQEAEVSIQIQNYKPIGGYESRASKLRKLSLATRPKEESDN